MALGGFFRGKSCQCHISFINRSHSTMPCNSLILRTLAHAYIHCLLRDHATVCQLDNYAQFHFLLIHPVLHLEMQGATYSSLSFFKRVAAVVVNMFFD